MGERPTADGVGSAERSLGPDGFVARCIACVAAGGGAEDIARLTRLALVSQREQPDAWGRREILHVTDNLMIVDLVLPPFATSAIHEHGTWAVVGISHGCEVDELLRERDGALEPTSREVLRSGDTLALAADCIHFIANPDAQPARGLHVYGRNLGQVLRRMWHPATAAPQPMDFPLFEQWEDALTAASAQAGAIVAPAIRRA